MLTLSDLIRSAVPFALDQFPGDEDKARAFVDLYVDHCLDEQRDHEGPEPYSPPSLESFRAGIEEDARPAGWGWVERPVKY